MILDVIVADTRVTVNNDRFTEECLKDIADKVNEEPDKICLYESLSSNKVFGTATRAKFDGKRLHIYFKFNRPYVSLAGNLPEGHKQKEDIFKTFEITKLTDFRFGLTGNTSAKEPHAFKVSGSVCSKCFKVDVTEDDQVVE